MVKIVNDFNITFFCVGDIPMGRLFKSRFTQHIYIKCYSGLQDLTDPSQKPIGMEVTAHGELLHEGTKIEYSYGD